MQRIAMQVQQRNHARGRRLKALLVPPSRRSDTRHRAVAAEEKED